MGDTLSAPITEKETTSGENSHVKYTSSCMQGWRRGMEDAHAHELKLSESDNNMFFGVYDGHGGKEVAEFVGQKLHKLIVETAEYKKNDIEGAMKQGFLDCDVALLDDPKLRMTTSGTTSVTMLMTPEKKAYIANAGDSRAVLCSAGEAIPLSSDHKPANEEEKNRIEAAGGFVLNNRVNGVLALSRAIGDREFKNRSDIPRKDQVVTAFPDVVIRQFEPKDEFVVLACDGIWDVMSNQEVVDFILERMKQNMPTNQLLEQLLDNCLATSAPGLGCDNMSVILVELKH